jgi:hypothetical protein
VTESAPVEQLKMRVTGYLVPFPDTGAADLMSEHLDQEFQATGPGQVVIKISLPRTRSEGTTGSAGSYARKKLELFQREGNDWVPLREVTSDSHQEWEEVSWEVSSSGVLRSRLTNMSGTEGQFSLECTFLPSE